MVILENAYPRIYPIFYLTKLKFFQDSHIKKS